MDTTGRHPQRERHASYKAFLQLLDSSPALGQSYETLLSSLRLLNGSRPLKTLLFTSSQPEEGKTTVAVGLALTMARAGKRTLLIDADLRRPQIHRILELDNAQGLTDVVAGNAQDSTIVRTIEIPASAGIAPCRLDVITSGHSSARALTALQSPSLADTIGKLAERYDAVLIDSPPVLSVSDSLLLASVVDGIVLIVNTGAVTEADARRAKERLERAGGRILGVVMNRFDETLYGPGFHPYHGYYEVPKVEELNTDLSIITVNYNSGELLLGCLRSVFEHTHDAQLEYFVVDNASRPDGSLDKIRTEYPRVRVLKNPTNVGFAAGCNVAFEHARGRYLLLLNPDTIVRPQALDRMIQFMDTRPDVGVLGSPLVNADGSDQGVAGRGFPTPLAFLFGRTTLLTRLFPGNRFSARFSSTRDPNRREPYEVDWVSGACMMIRRQAVERVGQLDPGYFFMWEDADWCFRVKQAGSKVYCFHEANVVHCEGGTRNRDWRALWLSTVAFHKGAYRYYRKHINARAFDPTHLLVIAGLAARGLLVLTTRSIKRARSGTANHSKIPSPPQSGAQNVHSHLAS